MTSSAPEVQEPISPELVLVSPPEVARVARERLPDRHSPERPSPTPTATASGSTMRVPPTRSATRAWTVRLLIAVPVLVLAVLAALTFTPRLLDRGSSPAWRSLDGSGNNVDRPDWGKEGTPYLRVAKPNFADGVARMTAGPSPRYISNRIFNDTGQNILSENGVSQWGWVWGQFLDHTFGLRNEKPGERAPIAFDRHDPLEVFKNDLGAIDFARTPASPGTGAKTPRQETNTVTSYIDAFAVYGGTKSRLEWLRAGPVDGTMSDNKASLLLPGGYLPRANRRGNVAASPPMDLMGALVGNRKDAVVAGDVRANENIALTAVHTLFAREHNRIVSRLPQGLSEEEKFQIARRVVGAEEQYITYQEFLPALGVHLVPYHGYNPAVDAAISNEFATVGYRVHSMVHGEFEPTAPVNNYSPKQLNAFRAAGVQVEREGKAIKLVIPLGLAYGNPGLLQAIGLGPALKGFGNERQYRNDEQIDDTMRSILFQIPKPGVRDPSKCGAPVVKPKCFTVVQDLGAIDVQRGRDHGMPFYNQMRLAYGLAPKTSYAAITGEDTSSSGNRSLLAVRNPIDDPRSLEFTALRDAEGKAVKPKTEEAQEDVVSATRQTTLASRLKGLYGAGNVNKIDAFVGMLSEPHVSGTEFGELQLAMWKRQFEALRDGDRFFYLNDPFLDRIRRLYGIDYRQTLANIIRLDTGVTVRGNLFKVPAKAT
jgi:Animal haem peroxidase